jgi:hypothetical protein
MGEAGSTVALANAAAIGAARRHPVVHARERAIR